MASIASEAGISSRTLYLYFPTKEDTLRYWREEGFANLLPGAVASQSRDRSPLEVATRGVLQLLETHDPVRSANIDRLTETNAALSDHKNAIMLQLEAQMFNALSELWPEPALSLDLRRLAMAVIGAMRIGMERWRDEGARLPVAHYVCDEFVHLDRFEKLP